MIHISFNLPPFPTFIKGGEAIFAKGKRHIRRTYTVFDLLYVRKGTLFISEGEKQFIVNEGKYLILIPGLEHSGYKGCEEETEYFWLHFKVQGNFKGVAKPDLEWKNISLKEETFEEPARFVFYIPQSQYFHQREMMEQLLGQIIQMGNEQTPDYQLRQQIRFQEFMLQLQKQAMQIPTATEQVSEVALKFIRENYTKQIKMAQIAAQLHFHPDYITRCVQKTIGISPTQYLYQYRIARARSLLSTTNDKISFVSREVGIEDQGYFSKLFKKLVGMSPLEYRRIVQRTDQVSNR
ncbi:AraC family transcriptional regulator [Paenisporosarcina sp. TG20]|uniref:AraC family transcriptional regulator n=1 Tax=Paenisporosarcina sp. TG20 TaxID=1211706 RepID=UPI0002DD83DC|nr:AraC family transcriptional regulator [Paenisporosarcina sp. TG20]